jgi:hypothetical protein
MRTSLIWFAVVLLIGHWGSAAYAYSGRLNHRYRSYSDNYSYPACQCHFGYNEKSAGECAINVACVNEGGRCQGHCPSLPNSP